MYLQMLKYGIVVTGRGCLCALGTFQIAFGSGYGGTQEIVYGLHSLFDGE